MSDLKSHCVTKKIFCVSIIIVVVCIIELKTNVYAKKKKNK